MNKHEEVRPGDRIALKVDWPAEGLSRGQVGRVVDQRGDDLFTIEFTDPDDRVFSTLDLKNDDMIRLHFRPADFPAAEE